MITLFWIAHTASRHNPVTTVRARCKICVPENSSFSLIVPTFLLRFSRLRIQWRKCSAVPSAKFEQNRTIRSPATVYTKETHTHNSECGQPSKRGLTSLGQLLYKLWWFTISVVFGWYVFEGKYIFWVSWKKTSTNPYDGHGYLHENIVMPGCRCFEDLTYLPGVHMLDMRAGGCTDVVVVPI